ncbi:MAG: hypothetical protein JOZ39_05790 [Chloroflexi bacterium]|nr:hypothetical protein [Chloroflexota bacterium]
MLQKLTQRELQVALLIAQGMTNPQIAGALVISPATASRHVKHILAKLQVQRRSQVAVLVSEATRSADASPAPASSTIVDERNPQALREAANAASWKEYPAAERLPLRQPAAIRPDAKSPPISVPALLVAAVGLLLTGALYFRSTARVTTPADAVLSFGTVDASRDDVDAGPYLSSFGITIENMSRETKLLVMDARRIYGGGVVVPEHGPNVLSQLGSNDPVTFTMRLSGPVAAVSFVRPRLEAGKNGITWPQWSVHGLNSSGNEVAAAQESGGASFSSVPARTVTLQSSGQKITALRWDSSNSASAFSAVLISDLRLSATSLAELAPADNWASNSSLPMAVTGAAAAAVGSDVYVAGGTPAAGCSTANLSSFDTTSGRWAAHSPMPTSRSLPGAAAIDGKLYVAGGWICADAKRPSDALEFYDPATDAWRQLAAMPRPRGAIALAAMGGRLYVTGGRANCCALSPELDIFDPKTGLWSQGAPMPLARESPAAAAINGKLYVAGGYERDPQDPEHRGGVSAKLDIYDPATNLWSAGPALPSPRMGSGAATLAGKLHLLGGSDAKGLLGVHDIFDPISGQWSADQPLSAARQGAAVAVAGDRLYLAGGTAAGGTILSSLESFTP